MSKEFKNNIRKENLSGLTVNSRNFDDGSGIVCGSRKISVNGVKVEKDIIVDKDSVPVNSLGMTAAYNSIRQIIYGNGVDKDITVVLFTNGDRVCVKRNKNDEDNITEAVAHAIMRHNFGPSFMKQIRKAVKKVGMSADSFSKLCDDKKSEIAEYKRDAKYAPMRMIND